MHDESATSEQLMHEICALRQRVAELEHAEAQRKQAEEALRQSEIHYRILLDNLPDAVFIHDLAGTLQDVNQEACRRLGYSRDELLQKHPWDFTQEKPHEGYGFVLEQLCANGQAIDDSEHITKTGEKIPCEIAMRLMVYHGQPVILAISRDISKRKQVEEALSASETKYRRLTEMMRDVIWALDAETLRFTYVSPSVIHLHGYTPEEIMAAPMEIALTGEHAGHVRELIAQRSAEFFDSEAAQDARYYRDEVQLLCKNGRLVWTEAITRYARNPNTGRLEVYGVTRDIHDRKRVEEALRRSEEALKEHHANLLAILENTDDIISLRDREHRLVFF